MLKWNGFPKWVLTSCSTLTPLALLYGRSILLSSELDWSVLHCLKDIPKNCKDFILDFVFLSWWVSNSKDKDPPLDFESIAATIWHVLELVLHRWKFVSLVEAIPYCSAICFMIGAVNTVVCTTQLQWNMQTLEAGQAYLISSKERFLCLRSLQRFIDLIYSFLEKTEYVFRSFLNDSYRTGYHRVRSYCVCQSSQHIRFVLDQDGTEYPFSIRIL